MRYALVWCLLAYMAGIFALHAVGLFPRASLYELSRLRGSSAITLEGKVLDTPMLRWGQTRFLVETRAQPLSAFHGRAIMTLPWIDEDLAPGDIVRARGWLSAPTERARDYWESRSVYSFLKVWYPSGFEIVRPSPPWSLNRAAWTFQKRYRAFWESRLTDRASALLLGVTIGARGVLPPDLKEACIRAGVYHIVVVSGQNMSLIVNFGLVLLVALAVPKRHAIWICLLPILFYTRAVGADPPVVRAAVSALVGLYVAALGRDIPSYYPLCLAAFWILIKEPAALLGASFQLSFAATLCILLFYPLWLEQKSRVKSWFRWCLEPALMGLAVYIGIWPLLVSYFHRLSVAGLLANWTVFPLSGILMVVGLILGTWGAVSPATVPPILIGFIRLLVDWMLWCIKVMAGWSWGMMSVAPPSPWLFGLYYGGLFGILILIHRRKTQYSINENSRPRL